MNKRIVGLLVLSVVPLLAGLTRLIDLPTGALDLEGTARFLADPVPAVLHMVGGTAFFTVGAFQFLPSLRNGAWHRVVGRVLAGLGVGSALAGMWMVWRWPPKEWDSPQLNAVRVLVACAIIAATLTSVLAARRRDLRAHEVWMTRAYALWAGAGTQVFTMALFVLPPLRAYQSEWLYTALMSAGWLINLVVAEALLRPARQPAHRVAVAR